MQLKGIVPPLVTPLSGRDDLDEAGLERLLQRQIEGGVHGLFALGTTGEAPSLSYRLRQKMVQRVCQHVGDKLPIMVGITDTSFTESIRLAEVAADAGATGLVLAAPYYFPAGQPELIEYIEDIIPRLPLPVMLYNMPGCTKLWFDLETLRALTHLEGIAGVKDSSGDLDYFAGVTTLKKERPDWSVMIGPEHMLVDSLALGGDGGVSGGANVFPRLFVETYEASLSGNATRVEELQSLIQRFQQLYEIGHYTSRFIKGTKCALSVLDICEDFMAEPFHRFRAPERQRVELIIKDMITALGITA